MRHDLQAKGSTEVRVVGEVGNQAAVVGPEKRLEHQAGEQLRLGELLGAELVGIAAQPAVGDREGLTGNAQRGFG